MKRKKYQKIKISLIISLIIAMIIGFLLIFFLEKNDSSVIFDNSKVTHQVDNSDITNILHEITSSYGTCNSGYELDFKDKTVLSAAELDESFKYNVIYNVLKRNNKIIKQYQNKNQSSPASEQASILDKTKYTEMLLITDVNDVYASLFGSKPQKNLNIFVRGDRLYNLKNTSYVVNIDENADIKCSKRVGYSIFSATSSKDKITLDYILYFSDNSNLNSYADENLQNKITTVGKENDYINDYTKYRFTFIGKNDNYILESVSLV